MARLPPTDWRGKSGHLATLPEEEEYQNLDIRGGEEGGQMATFPSLQRLTALATFLAIFLAIFGTARAPSAVPAMVEASTKRSLSTSAPRSPAHKRATAAVKSGSNSACVRSNATLAAGTRSPSAQKGASISPSAALAR